MVGLTNNLMRNCHPFFKAKQKHSFSIKIKTYFKRLLRKCVTLYKLNNKSERKITILRNRH